MWKWWSLFLIVFSPNCPGSSLPNNVILLTVVVVLTSHCFLMTVEPIPNTRGIIQPTNKTSPTDNNYHQALDQIVKRCLIFMD
jgi:hypothetical protein